MAQGSVAPAHVCSFDKLVDMTVIGRGGFGQVFRTKHRDWGLVAYKELPNTSVSSHQSIRELDKEVSIHRKLRHSNIVTLMALVFEPQHKGIVMQFEEYGDVTHFLRDFPVEWPWKLNLTLDIVLGMNYLHTQTRPIIHGDLKAKNVLIGSGYRAKIADFGLAFWKQLTQEVTQVNPGGTVSHVPPETWQNINGRRSEKYDVYGFAVLEWELLAFPKVPFHGVATNVISQTVLRGNRPSMTDIPSNVPSFLTGIVQDSWEQDPQRRPSFRALKDKLDGHVKLHEPDIKKSLIKLQTHESQRSCQQAIRPPAKRPHVATNPSPVQANDDTLRPHGIAAAAASPAGVINVGQHGAVAQPPTRDRPTGTHPQQVQDGTSQRSAMSPPHTLRSDRAHTPAGPTAGTQLPAGPTAGIRLPAGPTAGTRLPAGHTAGTQLPAGPTAGTRLSAAPTAGTQQQPGAGAASGSPLRLIDGAVAGTRNVPAAAAGSQPDSKAVSHLPGGSTRAVIDTMPSRVLTTRAYSVRDSQLTDENHTSGLTGPLQDMNVNAPGTRLTVQFQQVRLDGNGNPAVAQRPRVGVEVGPFDQVHDSTSTLLFNHSIALHSDPHVDSNVSQFYAAPPISVVSQSQFPVTTEAQQLVAVTSQRSDSAAVTDSQTRLKQGYNTPQPGVSPATGGAGNSCTCIAVHPQDAALSTPLSVEVSGNTVSIGRLCAVNEFGPDQHVACSPATSAVPNRHESLAAVQTVNNRPSSASAPYPVQVVSQTLQQAVNTNSTTQQQQQQQQQQ